MQAHTHTHTSFPILTPETPKFSVYSSRTNYSYIFPSLTMYLVSLFLSSPLHPSPFRVFCWFFPSFLFFFFFLMSQWFFFNKYHSLWNLNFPKGNTPVHRNSFYYDRRLSVGWVVGWGCLSTLTPGPVFSFLTSSPWAMAPPSQSLKKSLFL